MTRTTLDPGVQVSLVGIVLVGLAAAFLTSCGKRTEEAATESPLSDELVGTWFAYRDNVIENMWTFRHDGTCVNDGWPAAGVGPGNPALPYHLEGTYRVQSGQITVVFELEGGVRDTIDLKDPDITLNRLVYSAGTAPVAFLRERTAIGQPPTPGTEQAPVDEQLPKKLVGSWVALLGGFPVNTWTFSEDGTFVNEGWARLNQQTMLVRRLYQVTGRYVVSRERIVLTNEKLLQFDPVTNHVDAEMPISERIVLYDAAVTNGRLVYTNEVGLPVAFRLGTVTPTNW